MRSLHINLDQFVTFYFVAEERSFSRVSEKLCVSVPAVVKQIKSLEGALRVKLITVSKKKIYLTNIGTILLPHAEEIYRSALRAESLLLGCKDNLRVGISFGLTRRFLAIFDRFKETFPSICVNLRESSSLRLLAELLEFQHDLCIVATPNTVSSELRTLRIPKAEKMLLIAAPGSHLIRKREAKWEDLNDYPIVVHGEGSMSRRLILDAFQRHGVRPFIAASVDSMEATTELVRQGVGANFTLPWNVADDLASERLQAVPLKDGQVKLWIDIVLHKRVIQTAASRAFLALVQEDFGCTFDME